MSPLGWEFVLCVIYDLEAASRMDINPLHQNEEEKEYLCHFYRQLFQDCQEKKKNKVISLGCNAEGKVSTSD